MLPGQTDGQAQGAMKMQPSLALDSKTMAAQNANIHLLCDLLGGAPPPAQQQQKAKAQHEQSMQGWPQQGSASGAGAAGHDANKGKRTATDAMLPA